MFDTLKGTIDGIKETAGEIADKNSAANLRKHNEQRMAEAAEQEAAKKITKDKLSGGTASTVLGLGAKVLHGAIAAGNASRNLYDAMNTTPPPAYTHSGSSDHPEVGNGDISKLDVAPITPDNGERVKPITEKVPEWM